MFTFFFAYNKAADIIYKSNAVKTIVFSSIASLLANIFSF